MRRKLTVSYIVKEEIELDIIDYSKPESEIKDLVQAVVKPNATVHKFVWDIDPEPKVELDEDLFMQIGERRVATNGGAIFTQECPFVFDFYFHEFLEPTDKIKSFIEGLFAVDFRKLPLHKGRFSTKTECFKSLPNLEVRGQGKYEVGYFISNGVLLALIMPVKCSTPLGEKDSITFND